MTIDWAPYKGDIIALHEQGLNLKAIQEAIAKQATLRGEDFKPSERSWRTKLQAWGCRTYQGRSSGRENIRSKQRRMKQNTKNITFIPDSTGASLTAEFRHSPVIRGTSEHSESLTASSDTYPFPLWGGQFAYLEEHVGIFDFEKYPLHAAVQIHSEDHFPIYISRGLDINSRTQDDRRLTPLHVAILRGRRTDYIKSLLSLGADVSLADGHGSVSFHCAIRWNPGAISAILDEGIAGASTVRKAVEARDENGHTFLHLALIGHRKGFISAETLEATILTCASRYPCLPYDAKLPTGEPPIDFLMGTMFHEHHFSCRAGRENWWRSMLSNSTRLPSLKFLSSILPSEYAASEEVFFPGTRVGLLESLLKELPSEQLPRTQLDDLVSLGINLLCRLEGATGLSELLGYFIEGQCSKFWAQYPWGIETIWKRTWIEASVKDYLIYRGRPLLCRKSNKSFLIRAVDKVELPPAQHEYHISGFLARHNPRAAFYEEPDGRVPVFVAAERGLKTVVKTMFVAARNDILAGCDGQHSQIYDRIWPNFTRSIQHEHRASFASKESLKSVSTVFKTWNLSTSARMLFLEIAPKTFYGRSSF